VLLLVAAVYRAPAAAASVKHPAGGSGFGLSLREFSLVSLAGIVWALFNVGYIIVVSFTPSLLMAHGLSAAEAAAATSLASWTLIPTIALGGMLLDRMGHATALMITSLAALGLGIMLMPSTSSFALIAFIGAISGLPAGAVVALPAEVLRPQSRAPGMGIFFTWYYAGMALLTPVAGLVRDLTGGPSAPLIFAGALELAAIMALGLLRWFQRR